MGTLMMAAGEGNGSYGSRLRQMAIAGPIAACGYLTGYLTHLPFPLVVAGMTVIAFIAGTISSYGAAYSIGAMQALLVAALAIGLPEIGAYWQLALLYLAGIALYALTLGVEALIDRRRPERRMLADLVATLAHLAQTRASVPEEAGETPAVEAARRAVTDRSRALYAELMEARRGGHTSETVVHAEILDAAESVFSLLIAGGDPKNLAAAGTWLAALAEAVRRRAPAPPLPSNLFRSGTYRRLATAICGGSAVPRGAVAPKPEAGARIGPGWTLRRLAVGPAVLKEAAALAACIGVAFSMKYLIQANHWYWIPLTVAVVMKPDFGSVFVRAVLRSIGTSAGVAIGVALMILLPSGWPLVFAIAVFAAMLPWAKSVSYAAQAVALTPLVLVLIDLIAPVAETVNFGWQRFADTLIGGAIVLIFGYFLLPRSHAQRLMSDYAAALATTADYLVAVGNPGGAGQRRVKETGWAAYARLSDLRAGLARSMAEPPPAGREAAAWFPLVAGAERICDRITALAAGLASGDPPPPAADVEDVAARIRSVGQIGDKTQRPLPDPKAVSDPTLDAIAEDARQLTRRLEGP